jgi:hypothetical protein
MDQLEWGDNLLRHAPKGKFYNPADLYIHLIKENVIPPETFESTRKRTLREAASQVQEREEQDLARISLAYLQYKDPDLPFSQCLEVVLLQREILSWLKNR